MDSIKEKVLHNVHTHVDILMIAKLSQAICIAVGVLALSYVSRALARQISGFWESTSRNNSCIKSMGNVPILYLLAVESIAVFIVLSQLFAVLFVSVEASPQKAIAQFLAIGCSTIALSIVANSMALQASKLFEGISNEPETLDKSGNFPILYFVSMESVAIFIIIGECLMLFLVK